jgi:lysophospholipid acyltransferase (LPLAT)-like uncharacterized protein
MKFRKARQNFLRFIGNYFIVSGLNVLFKSLKINYQNREVVENLEAQSKNYIVAFWHNTMLLPWYLNRNKNFAALTSKSKDGDLLAKILRKWNYTVVRGSSSVGGDVALGIMIDYARNNKSVAVTPDGPRGPVFKMKAGAVITAKKSGLPLILMGVGFKRKRVLKSWDKFEVPKYLSAANVIYSNPFYIEKNLNYNETSAVIEECEKKLIEIQHRAGIFK